MGYYKKLSSERQGRSSAAAKRLSKATSTNALVDVSITVDIRALVQEFERVGNYKTLKKDRVKNVHKKVAESGARAMRKVITDYPRTIKVRRSGRFGGKPGADIDVAPGTLKRSIAAIDPGNGTNYWMGPRSSAVSGVTPLSKSDGWFAHIVDGGDQFFGPGKNKNFFSRGLARGAKNMEAALYRNHTKELSKHIER